MAFNPPVSVTEFGLPNGSFVPDLSTVVLPENAVSYSLCSINTLIEHTANYMLIHTRMHMHTHTYVHSITCNLVPL